MCAAPAPCPALLSFASLVNPPLQAMFDFILYKACRPARVMYIGCSTIVIDTTANGFEYLMSDLVNYVWHGLTDDDRSILSKDGL